MSDDTATQAAPVTLTEKHVRYMGTINSAHGYERLRVVAYAEAKPKEAIEVGDGSYSSRRLSIAEARALAKALAAAADAAQLAAQG